MNLHTAYLSVVTLNRGRYYLRLGRFAMLAFCVGFFCSKAAAENAPVADNARPPMVEMEAKFVRATAQQMHAAAVQGDIENSGLVLAPEQTEKVLESLKKNGAEFFSNPRTLTRSGRRAVVEAIRELRYPTEYEPSKTELGKFLPTNFETRNVGVTLEFEPKIAPDGSLEIDLVPQVVKFRGFVDYSNQKTGTYLNDPDEIERLLKVPLKEGGIWQPIFATQKITTSVSIHSGETALIKFMGTVDHPSGEPRAGSPGPTATSELSNYVFITARTLTTE